MKYQPIDIARQFLFVREVPPNRGQRVNGIQQWCADDHGEGQSWCCYFVTFVLDICFQGKAPIAREGRCQTVYELAKKNDWLTEIPVPGDIVLHVDAKDHAHHIGIVTGLSPLTSIAGNTDATGTSSNGDRVAEHAINPVGKKFVRVPQ